MATSSTRAVQYTGARSTRSNEPVARMDTAARLISQAAHDIRPPLAAIRDSIEKLIRGRVGEVTSDQQSVLDSAIDGCERIEQMVGEMLQLEGLRRGTPRVHREWIPVSSIRQTVDKALRTWAVPQKIDVLWDGADLASATVFADANMLSRLIVNLVTNSIRETPCGGCVLIRLQRARGNETILWSIIDQGTGLRESEMHQIAADDTETDGFEISICRQMAALQFSSLQLHSRVGSGSEVSFETAAYGPRSVAGAWSRWRVAQNQSAETDAAQANRDGEITPHGRRLRLDPPVIAVDLAQMVAKPRCRENVAVGIVSVGAAVSRAAADAFDVLLQSQLQMFDFAYRAGTRHWVWAFDTEVDGVIDRIESIIDATAKQLPSVRMNWSDPQLIPIDQRRTNLRLTDLLVRESLAAFNRGQIVDKNEVRLGTDPISGTETPSERLDEELIRLTAKLKQQTEALQQQARNLRPIR